MGNRGQDKLNLFRTLNDISDNLPKSRGDCFDYGSWNGCDLDCPALNNGLCEVWEEVLQPKTLKEIDEDYETVKELLDLYE